jgi:hypothetical protein
MYMGNFYDFRFTSCKADYLVGIDPVSRDTVAFLALREDGEAICFWVAPYLRGSDSMTRFYLNCYLIGLKEGLIGNSLSTIKSTTSVSNIASNKAQISEGYKLVGTETIDGNEFNKYSIEKSDLIVSIGNYLSILG